ncbi:unnamed protein product [Urochloa humidicola]
MATGCYGGARRLSDLLQEQQEPFLPPPQRRSPIEAATKALRCGGFKTARKALLQWDLAGCFNFKCGARQSFRRLPRAVDIAGRCDDAAAGGRQLSPVSVLELHSDDEESPALSQWEDDNEPSTSACSPESPPSDHDHHLPGAATFFVTTNGKIRAMEAEAEGNNAKRPQRKSTELSFLEEMERATISGWERIAADISRIPTLVALDLSRTAREWSPRRVAAAGEEEARRVGQSVETIIFEELTWEAVRDMICLRDI